VSILTCPLNRETHMKQYQDCMLAIFHLGEWRLIPWYSRTDCSMGCCTRRVFTWLFFAFTLVSSTRPPKED
jgi:hypothetical protein